jgi:hypothetical protein
LRTPALCFQHLLSTLQKKASVIENSKGTGTVREYKTPIAQHPRMSAQARPTRRHLLETAPSCSASPPSFLTFLNGTACLFLNTAKSGQQQPGFLNSPRSTEILPQGGQVEAIALPRIRLIMLRMNRGRRVPQQCQRPCRHRGVPMAEALCRPLSCIRQRFPSCKQTSRGELS